MSGYLQRLIARSMGTDTDVRPLSPQPYANYVQEKVLTSRDDQYSVTDSTNSMEAIEGANNQLSKTGVTATTDSNSSVDSKPNNSSELELTTQNLTNEVIRSKSAPSLLSPPEQPAFIDRHEETAKATNQPSSRSADEFHLLPIQPVTATVNALSPFSPKRNETGEAFHPDLT